MEHRKFALLWCCASLNWIILCYYSVIHQPLLNEVFIDSACKQIPILFFSIHRVARFVSLRFRYNFLLVSRRWTSWTKKLNTQYSRQIDEAAGCKNSKTNQSVIKSLECWFCCIVLFSLYFVVVFVQKMIERMNMCVNIVKLNHIVNGLLFNVINRLKERVRPIPNVQN